MDQQIHSSLCRCFTNSICVEPPERDLPVCLAQPVPIRPGRAPPLSQSRSNTPALHRFVIRHPCLTTKPIWHAPLAFEKRTGPDRLRFLHLPIVRLERFGVPCHTSLRQRIEAAFFCLTSRPTPRLWGLRRVCDIQHSIPFRARMSRMRRSSRRLR